MNATTLTSAFVLLLVIHVRTQDVESVDPESRISPADVTEPMIPCFANYTCPGAKFCFVNECLSYRTVGESCRYGMQCRNPGAFCSSGVCSCLTTSDRFDGSACVMSYNFLTYPLIMAIVAGLSIQILATLLVVFVVKYKRAKRALAAAQAAPLPQKLPFQV